MPKGQKSERPAGKPGAASQVCHRGLSAGRALGLYRDGDEGDAQKYGFSFFALLAGTSKVSAGVVGGYPRAASRCEYLGVGRNPHAWDGIPLGEGQCWLW